MGEITPMRKSQDVAIANDEKVNLESLEFIKKTTRRHHCDLSGDAFNSHERALIQTGIPATREWIASGEHKKALEEITAASWPPAEKALRTEVSKLIAAFPNAPSKADLRAFGALLLEHVRARRPSKGALAKAAWTLQATCRFVPTIAEVLEALEEAEADLRYVLKYLERMPEAVESAAKSYEAAIEAMRPRTPEELAAAEAARIERRRKWEAEREERLRVALEQGGEW
jgi:hypothetical protein